MSPVTSQPDDDARIVAVEVGFNIKRPNLRPTVFASEYMAATADTAPSGFTLLDCSDVLLCDYPATTPTLLARYLRLRPGGSVTESSRSSGDIFYVLRGQGESSLGESSQGTDRIAWNAGDIFCLPGGIATHQAMPGSDCLLYTVGNQPMLAFLGADAATGAMPAVRYRAAMLNAEIESLRRRQMGADTAGRAVFLTSLAMQNHQTCLPGLTLTLNLVLPGERQRPHRHNAAALVLGMQGGDVHSTIDGQRFPWREGQVLLTPPGAVHDHDNPGSQPGLALIVQDGGLHYYMRTMGFAFA